jgi:hypothetical protein
LKELICHCFGYIRADIEQDVVAHGKSTIIKRIVSEKKVGRCHCATLNSRWR